MFAHRPTNISGVDPKTDRVVFMSGKEVGRVYYKFPLNGFGPWRWASWVHPNPHGHADTMSDALECVKAVALANLD